MKVAKWVFFSILLPLAPMFLAVLIKIGQELPVEYYKLLGGMEIYILSVTVFASTLNDLENSSETLRQTRPYRILTGLLLPCTIISSMVFTVVFVDEHVQQLGVSKTFVADLGIGLGIVTATICVPLQIIRYLAEKSASGEE